MLILILIIYHQYHHHHHHHHNHHHHHHHQQLHYRHTARKVHSRGKRVYHPFSDISPEGRVDCRIFTMDGEQLTDYDTSYAQQRVDIDQYNNDQQQLQQQQQEQQVVAYDENYNEHQSMTEYADGKLYYCHHYNDCQHYTFIINIIVPSINPSIYSFNINHLSKSIQSIHPFIYVYV